MVNDNSMSEFIQKRIAEHRSFIESAQTARQYYRNKNNIKLSGAVNAYKNEQIQQINPLKLSDNRISHNWHNILVNQKVGYLLTYAPIIDSGESNKNERIIEILGDGKFVKTLKNVAIDAANCGVGWVHYWKNNNEFKYSVVDPEQIIPVYTNSLEEELIGVLRCYRYINDDGKGKNRCEYWDKNMVRFYEETSNNVYVPFKYPEIGEEMQHNMGRVPFVPFYNNQTKTNDLIMYQDLIDAYDKVYSGFNNDIDDVQQIVFIIKNYGGTDIREFVEDLKSAKAIKVDDDGGVDTIRAEIPHEARKVFLDMTRKQIFTSGMGVDPDNEKIGNASGVALKFLYSLLELKAGLTETEFRESIEILIKAACSAHSIPVKKIHQTWTRNAIQNDMETAQIASQSKDIVSDGTILKNHPWVDDVEKEKKEIAEEQDRKAELQKQKYGMIINTPSGDED